MISRAQRPANPNNLAHAGVTDSRVNRDWPALVVVVVVGVAVAAVSPVAVAVAVASAVGFLLPTESAQHHVTASMLEVTP